MTTRYLMQQQRAFFDEHNASASDGAGATPNGAHPHNALPLWHTPFSMDVAFASDGNAFISNPNPNPIPNPIPNPNPNPNPNQVSERESSAELRGFLAFCLRRDRQRALERGCSVDDRVSNPNPSLTLALP